MFSALDIENLGGVVKIVINDTVYDHFKSTVVISKELQNIVLEKLNEDLVKIKAEQAGHENTDFVRRIGLRESLSFRVEGDIIQKLAIEKMIKIVTNMKKLPEKSAGAMAIEDIIFEVTTLFSSMIFVFDDETIKLLKEKSDALEILEKDLINANAEKDKHNKSSFINFKVRKNEEISRLEFKFVGDILHVNAITALIEELKK